MANPEGRILVRATEHTFIQGEIVTVLVGKKEKPFAVHKDLLVSRSSWFAAELAKSKPCKLLNVEEECFDLYLQCVYTGRLPCRAPHDVYTEEQDIALAEVCALAALLDDEKTMHAGLSAFIETFRDWAKEHGAKSGHPYSDSIAEAYRDGLAIDGMAPLRKLMVDLVIWASGTGAFHCVGDDEFRQDLCNAAIAAVHNGMKGGKEGWKTITCCDYHTRADGKVCGSKKRKREAAEGQDGNGEGGEA